MRSLTHFSYPLMQISPHFIEKTLYLCSQKLKNSQLSNYRFYETNNDKTDATHADIADGNGQ